MSLRSFLAVLVTSLLFVFVACSDSEDTSGNTACGSGGSCPSGFTCVTATHVCVRVADAAVPDAVLASADASSAPDAVASSADAPAVGAVDAPLAIDAMVAPDAPNAILDAASTPDVSPPDAAPTPPPDAQIPPVSVSIVLGGVPRADVAVVFQDSSGNIVSSTTTSASGTAQAIVPANSMVTIDIEPLTTVTGIQPNEHLTIADPPTPPARTLDIDFERPADSTNLSSAVCQLAINGLPTPVPELCANDPTLLVGIVAGNNGVPNHVGYAEVAVTGTSLTTTVDNWMMPATLSFSMRDPGGSADSISIWTDFDSDSIDFFDVPHSVDLTVPGDLEQIPVRVEIFGHVGNFTRQVTSLARMTVANQGSIDLDPSRALPLISDRSGPGGTLARPTVTWLAEGSMSEADGGVIDIDFGGRQWDFVVAPATQSLRVPSLPASFGLAVGDATNIAPMEANFYQLSGHKGFADFRQNFRNVATPRLRSRLFNNNAKR